MFVYMFVYITNIYIDFSFHGDNVSVAKTAASYSATKQTRIFRPTPRSDQTNE